MFMWQLFKFWKFLHAFYYKYKKQCLFVLLGGGVVYTIAMVPRLRPILPKAIPVTQIPSSYPFYWWLSDGEVLLFRLSEHQEVIPMRYQTATRKETLLVALRTFWRQHPGKPETVQVSPDGKWLLWKDMQGKTQVASLDGTHHFSVSSQPTGLNRWLSDSHHWVELVPAGDVFSYANIRSIDKPYAPKSKPLFPPFPSTPEQANIDRIALADDEHILVHYWNEAPGKLHPSRVIAATFTPNPLFRGKFSFTTPRTDYEYGDILFAPQTKRLAWVLEFYQPYPPYSYTGFWTKELSQIGIKEIGYTIAFGSKHRSKPQNVQWTPDGKHLSFVYRDTLWKVSVE
jgi:hypothetical protein